MLENIRFNDFGSRIDPHRILIAEKTGQRGFIALSNEIGSSGGQMFETDNPERESCYSIDDLINYSFDFPDPNHIKIDIDGQEWKVIQGMMETLKTSKLKSVLVEINQDRAEIISAFIDNCFTVKNPFNFMANHSDKRRQKEGIKAENVIFTRRINGKIKS
jgi:FkbM family methyltransferase